MKSFYLFAMLCLFSCDSPVRKEMQQPNRFYYTFKKKYREAEVMKDSTLRKHEPNDTLLTTLVFLHQDKRHEISMYTNESYPIDDGGFLMYELDTLGIFFGRSITWRGNCLRLHSTNEETEKLINTAIDNILAEPNLHCYTCSPDDLTIPQPKP